MFDNKVSRQWPSGANSYRDTDPFSDIPYQDTSLYHIYYNDFDAFITGNWTTTQIGAGSQALVAGDGGILQTVTGAVASNSVSTQNLFPSFATVAGQRFWGRFLFSVDSLLANVIVGKTNATTTPYTGGQLTDGVWMSTSGGTGVISVNIAAGGTIATINTGVSLVAGLANQCRFSWYWDGGVYQAAPNGRIVATLDGAGVTAKWIGEFGGSSSSATAFPAGFPSAVNTTIQFDIQAQTGVARTMNMDMITLQKERYNINASPLW